MCVEASIQSSQPWQTTDFNYLSPSVCCHRKFWRDFLLFIKYHYCAEEWEYDFCMSVCVLCVITSMFLYVLNTNTQFLLLSSSLVSGSDSVRRGGAETKTREEFCCLSKKSTIRHALSDEIYFSRNHVVWANKQLKYFDSCRPHSQPASAENKENRKRRRNEKTNTPAINHPTVRL